ncbi:MAG: dephospho-CoA kinase [Candidatus Brocadiaceae bacterium]|jgi:dephospho-CoA kinase
MNHTHQRPAGPPVVGILGGVASGKSTIARLLAERGAAVVDADEIGHEVLRLRAVREAVIGEFGAEVLDETGDISRSRLAERVFGDNARVRKLNRIVHPPILRRIRGRIRNLKQENAVPLIVLDAALLAETDLHRDLCQSLLFVAAPEETRRQRAREGRDMSSEQFSRRSEAQMAVREKRKLADFVVDNSGSLEELEQEVDELWPELCKTAGRAPTHEPST